MAEREESVPSEAPLKRKLEDQPKLEIAASKKLRTFSAGDDFTSLGETEHEAAEGLTEQAVEKDCKTGSGGEICDGAMIARKDTFSVSGKEEEEGEGELEQEDSKVEEEEEDDDDDSDDGEEEVDASELDEDEEGDDDEDSYDEGERSPRQEGTSSKGKEKIDSKGKGIMVDSRKGKAKMEDEEVINEDDAGYLSEDPLEEVDLNNILPTKTRRSSSTMHPLLHADAGDLADDDDDEEDDDYYNDE